MESDTAAGLVEGHPSGWRDRVSSRVGLDFRGPLLRPRRTLATCRLRAHWHSRLLISALAEVGLVGGLRGVAYRAGLAVCELPLGRLDGCR